MSSARNFSIPVLSGLAMSTGTSRSVGQWLAVTYAITWIAMIPAVLHFRGICAPPMGLVLLGAVIGSAGPSLAAVALVVGRDGFRSLLAAPGSSSWGRRLVWIAVALAFPVVLHVLGAGVARVLGAPSSVFDFGTPSNSDQFGILVVAPLGEELGWRGFAQRRLEKQRGALAASVIIGFAWALWHLPMIIGRPPGGIDIAVSSALIVFGSVIFAALFRASKGSVLVAIAAHAGVHLDNVSRLGGPPLYATCGAMFIAAVLCGRWLAATERV